MIGEPLPETNAVDWLDNLLSRAIQLRASDIHIEPTREVLSIRFRIDGSLHLIENIYKGSYETIISRIKVISQLDSIEHRLPQGGHFESNYKNRLFNIRVSTFPVIYGEAVVMRILNREDVILNLKDLGFDPYQFEAVDKLIKQPYGMILITGPSGSGKTTLLYSILNVLSNATNNIITIEDPVEIQVEGMRQAQVYEYSDFNFATALRSVLRQDPDILMVGEIRDEESAQIAIQAALTGRLVLSTFHTLNVFAVISRLIEMEIPQSVIANAIMGVISTRLVRKICPTCREVYTPTEEEKIILSQEVTPNQLFYRGKGCEKCLKSGYFGRTGVFEVIPFDNEIRALILEEKPRFLEMVRLLQSKKIKALTESAMDKVYQGITTLQEVIRVTGLPTKNTNH